MAVDQVMQLVTQRLQALPTLRLLRLQVPLAQRLVAMALQALVRPWVV
jgi:hypothetical protein